MSRQAFPGNIRQLQHLIERAVLLSITDRITAADLQTHLDTPTRTGSLNFAGRTLQELEETAVRHALDRNRGNLAAAARDLGITRSALYRRLDKYGIDHES
ncbi:MAG: helix-turn-helix domain-containing protein [Saprospiraceae bacterium]